MRIDPVREVDVGDLLPMLGAYCDFYRVDPGRQKLENLARELLGRPDEGTQFIARDEAGDPTGFATVYWTWNTLVAGRVGVLHDLFVWPEHRGHGIGRALIDACLERARDRGAAGLTWDTAPDNARAQALYDSTGARRSEWVAYRLDA
ncbi:MAG: GNAT family N-acetyltransferase [Solirubrobacterales bacterium]